MESRWEGEPSEGQIGASKTENGGESEILTKMEVQIGQEKDESGSEKASQQELRLAVAATGQLGSMKDQIAEFDGQQAVPELKERQLSDVEMDGASGDGEVESRSVIASGGHEQALAGGQESAANRDGQRQQQPIMNADGDQIANQESINGVREYIQDGKRGEDVELGHGVA